MAVDLSYLFRSNDPRGPHGQSYNGSISIPGKSSESTQQTKVWSQQYNAQDLASRANKGDQLTDEEQRYLEARGYSQVTGTRTVYTKRHYDGGLFDSRGNYTGNGKYSYYDSLESGSNVVSSRQEQYVLWERADNPDSLTTGDKLAKAGQSLQAGILSNPYYEKASGSLSDLKRWGSEGLEESSDKIEYSGLSQLSAKAPEYLNPRIESATTSILGVGDTYLGWSPLYAYDAKLFQELSSGSQRLISFGSVLIPGAETLIRQPETLGYSLALIPENLYQTGKYAINNPGDFAVDMLLGAAVGSLATKATKVVKIQDLNLVEMESVGASPKLRPLEYGKTLKVFDKPILSYSEGKLTKGVASAPTELISGKQITAFDPLETAAFTKTISKIDPLESEFFNLGQDITKTIYKTNEPVIQPTKFEVLSENIPSPAKAAVKEAVVEYSGEIDVYGSVSQKLQLGDYMSRSPKDLEVIVDDSGSFVQFLEQKLSDTGTKYTIKGVDTPSPKVYFDTPEGPIKGIEIFQKDTSTFTYEDGYSQKTEIAYGYNKQSPINVEGLDLTILSEQTARKYAGATTLKDLEIRPTHEGRIKDVQDFIEIGTGYAIEKGLPIGDQLLRYTEIAAEKYPQIMDSPVVGYILENKRLPTTDILQSMPKFAEAATERSLMFSKSGKVAEISNSPSVWSSLEKSGYSALVESSFPGSVWSSKSSTDSARMPDSVASSLAASQISSRSPVGSMPTQESLVSSLAGSQMSSRSPVGSMPTQKSLVSSLAGSQMSSRSPVGSMPTQESLVSSLAGSQMSSRSPVGSMPTQESLVSSLAGSQMSSRSPVGSMPTQESLVSSLASPLAPSQMSSRSPVGSMPTQESLVSSLASPLAPSQMSSRSPVGSMPTQESLVSSLAGSQMSSRSPVGSMPPMPQTRISIFSVVPDNFNSVLPSPSKEPMFRDREKTKPQFFTPDLRAAIDGLKKNKFYNPFESTAGLEEQLTKRIRRGL
ncbi:MAG: hypothetical protein ACC612_11440 [Methanomethylovorans sp.]|uniref:hypothetical protein n=1 Tax=Methanomethylovorans sp. TaxID=2758717 RepID=UPI003530D6CC